MLQTVSDARRMLAPVFDQYGVSKAVLFGSIAKGTATPKSDLDLLVQSDLKGLKFVSELPKKLTLNKLALIGEAEKSP